MEQETTFYRFLSEIRAFLSKLVKDPIKADVSKYLKERAFNKTKTINVLLKRDVLERHEKILDSMNSDEKEPKYTVKYKVRKTDFENRIYKIYIKYFEKNLPEKEEDKKPVDECDCGGAIGGATSADVCNMSAPTVPFGSIQRRGIGIGSVKKKKKLDNDILGKTITAESKKIAHQPRTCYITEAQLKRLLGEDTSESMSGIDERMHSLAEKIYKQAFSSDEDFQISPEEINQCQNYFVAKQPIHVQIIYNGNTETLASFCISSNIMVLNKAGLYYFDTDDAISTITHELTHMVTDNRTCSNSMRNYETDNIQDWTDIAYNDYVYMFNPSEIQARLSQYNYLCKRKGSKNIAPINLNKILLVDDMQELIRDLSIDDDEHLNIIYNLYCVFRERNNKSDISPENFMKNKDAIFLKIKNYYQTVFDKYLQKANKIYKYYSKQDSLAK